MADRPQRRVLIAEPDPDQRARLTELVRKAAAEGAVETTIAEASDGSTAMASWSEHPPDLVVAEVLLPGISGLALMRRMSAEQGTLPPVVLVTELTRESDRYWGLRNGAHAYVRKPYDDDTLVRRLRSALVKGRDAEPERSFPTGD
jgi:twitching motility two-component system response regulator PilH